MNDETNTEKSVDVPEEEIGGTNDEYEQSEYYEAESISAYAAGANNKKKQRQTALIICLLVIVSALLIWEYVQSQRVLVTVYGKYCVNDDGEKERWAEISDDGTYLELDSKPVDSDLNDYYVDMYFDDMDYDEKEVMRYLLDVSYTDEVTEAVRAINEEIGIPESVLNQMYETTSLDGMQTYEKGNITISWTYHPDNGLEVTYTLN